VKHSTLWQHPKYFFHKAPPRPVNVTETEKPAVKTVKKSWGQVNPDAAGEHSHTGNVAEFHVVV
jgi:hypothetical protein